ncbi:MAG: DNA-binding protein WhiA [Lachnospiraceae bacterium]|nr:DNA-binding protein WhiA [Lachnospiraceae bacterium]
MSFSGTVKEELAAHVSPARHCQLAELAALLLYNGGVCDSGRHLCLDTENEAVARKCFTLLKKTFNIETVMRGRRRLIPDDETERRVIEALYLAREEDGKIILTKSVNSLLIKNSCCARAWLRGAFLSVGSMSDPRKGYHLEFVCDEKAQAVQLREVLSEFQIEARIIGRKKYQVVYLKEGAGIVDLLNVMGAHVALMDLENMRILKEMRNSINRRVNCETANISKTVTAAGRQIEDILLIRDRYGFENLPDNLRQMAEVRLEYPDAALKELGGYLEPVVGKSGVNHRLRRLSEIADKIRS